MVKCNNWQAGNGGKMVQRPGHSRVLRGARGDRGDKEERGVKEKGYAVDAQNGRTSKSVKAVESKTS